MYSSSKGDMTGNKGRISAGSADNTDGTEM